VSANIKNSAGFTIVELTITVVVAAILLGTLFTVTFWFYGNTIQNSTQARLAVESQNILRTIVEELRVASSIRPQNLITDPHAPDGQWTTSNESLVLIISTPVINGDNEFVVNEDTGNPYQNELVYYAIDGLLYKRFLANPNADGNLFTTSCPPEEADSSCPADVKLSDYFRDMHFTFYDQDDSETGTLTSARSVRMVIEMERAAFGRSIEFQNDIRMTMRNRAL
jgi:type II secretory pathway pseudopilin PulG